MRTLAVYLTVAIVFLASSILPIATAEQDTMRVVFSSPARGTMYYPSVKGGNLSRLHTDGKYIKDEFENILLLKGVCLYEAGAYIDHLKNNDAIVARVARLKELGVNYIRLPINKADWDANRDTNGDGIGARDFNYQVIDAFTEAGIYVFVGLHYGVDIAEEQSWASNPQIVVDWYINNIINRYRNNPGVNIYVWNEPHYEVWGGNELDGLTTGYWGAMKTISAALHNLNPNMLLIVHANGGEKFSSVLSTDPILVPNVIYTWHYYYAYGPAFNPYLGWLSGVEDPTYQELKNIGMPFYQSYAIGNYTQAKQEFEQYLYSKFLWVPTELNLSIVNDEFGFNGDEIPYFSYRACDICLAANDGKPQNGVTFWKVSETYADAGRTTLMQPPYTGTSYCPRFGHAMPQPQPYAEPAWQQAMRDFIQIMQKYSSSWNYFPWWPKTYGGYGLSNDDVTTLSKIGDVWKDYVKA